MVNTNELKGFMAKNGYNNKTAAQLLGISPNTFSRKLHGVTEFTLSEAQKMVEAFEIHEPASVFFTPSVPNTQREEGEVSDL